MLFSRLYKKGCAYFDTASFRCIRRGLQRVHVELQGTFEVGGLVLVDDVGLGQLVQHRGYLRGECLGGGFVGGVARAFTALRAVL